MKKATLAGALFLGALVTVTSCKKYEEGPGLSLRSKTARITNTWVVDKYVAANGTETQDTENTEVELKEDGKGTWKSEILGIPSSFDGTWKLDDDKTHFITDISFGGISLKDTVEIILLKNKEFGFKDEDGDKTYWKEKE